MKKIMMTAAIGALCATVAFGEGVTSGIVGYQNVSVPNGFSLFTATFKNIGTTTSIDLTDLKPADPKGKVLSLSDSTFYVCVVDQNGNYSSHYMWRGKTLGGWSLDGVNLLPSGTVTIDNGVGILVYNNIKVDTEGNESTAKKATSSPALIQVSGEVDLVCKNLIATGFSISGNSTPSSFDLKRVKPTDMNGKVLSLSDSTVYVCLLDSAGNYGEHIMWRGKTLGDWSKDGTNVIADNEVVITPGCGLLIYNNVKADANGDESTAKKATATTIYLTLPPPVSK